MNKHIALNKKEIHQFSDALKDSMSRNDIKEIALRQVKKSEKLLSEQGIFLSIDDKAIDNLDLIP